MKVARVSIVPVGSPSDYHAGFYQVGMINTRATLESISKVLPAAWPLRASVFIDGEIHQFHIEKDHVHQLEQVDA